MKKVHLKFSKPFRVMIDFLRFSILIVLIPVLLSCAGFQGFKRSEPKAPVSRVSDKPLFFRGEKKPLPFKTLPVNKPVQITHETDPVFHAAVSRDGKWLIYAPRPNELTGLWVRSADPNRILLPKPVHKSGGREMAPSISHDNRWVAYVGTEHDVKGDIFIASLTGEGKSPRRLTGRETTDRAPSFSPDGTVIYFHQTGPGASIRRIVAIGLNSQTPEPRYLDTKGDGAFPSLSPDGRQCVFVSNRKDRGGDIFLKDLENGGIIQLTKGPAQDIYPVWSIDGRYVYFTRFAVDTNHDGRITPEDNGVLYRIKANDPDQNAYPLTSAAYSAIQPMVTDSGLYFLSTLKGATNLWRLPLEGEIPLKENAEEQFDLAGKLAGQAPLDPHLTILSYYRVIESFRKEPSLGGRSAYAIGTLYQRINMENAAEEAFIISRDHFANTLSESALSGIRIISIRYSRKFIKSVNNRERKSLLKEALSKITAIANQYPDFSRIQSESMIEQAQLLGKHGMGIQSLMEAITLLEKVHENDEFKREQRAEAAFLRAGLLGRAGFAERVIPAYEDIIKAFPGEEGWAARAVEKFLDLTLKNFQPENNEAWIRQLNRVAEKYRYELPALAMGALNRIGDITFEEGEWVRAKRIYRQVLEQFASRNVKTTAARLALAEILYREERFRDALDLYEAEMAVTTYRDNLYLLARRGYIRKSIAAAEHHFRLGEIAAAGNIFFNLIKYDYSIVEAHRGYIKCAVAKNNIPELLNRYRDELIKDPDDPVTLYATGLSLTYMNGKNTMEEARSLIHQAIIREGQVEYFHQTMGYVLEVLETVYGKAGGLEEALESFRKALFLNNPRTNPENRANLHLNLGNIFFLLKHYGRAYEHYVKRFDSGKPFDHEDTEILFYRRFGAAAFQIQDTSQPIMAYKAALNLIEKRVRIKRASEMMGRINRYIQDRIISPALKGTQAVDRWKKLAERQADLNRNLFEVSRIPAAPPPDPSWHEYRKEMELLIGSQEKIIRDLETLIGDTKNDFSDTLSHMELRARNALHFPENLIQLKAEMLDRLALAYQEAGEWKKARETFEQTYLLNERLGLVGNLVNNQRSIAYNAYMGAGNGSREDREKLLEMASEGFNRVIGLVDKFGVAKKSKVQRKEAIVNLAFDIALDQVSSSQAMYGFTADQEKRLAEAFIHRIQIELGNLKAAYEVLKNQLVIYPEKKAISDRDLYGVALLFHRAGHLAHALKKYGEAFNHFRRSAELCHRIKNPISAALNLKNMAQALAKIPPDTVNGKSLLPQLIALDRKTANLLKESSVILESNFVPAYHNAMGVWAMGYWKVGPAKSLETGIMNLETLRWAGTHFSKGLESLDQGRERQTLRLRSAIHLNLAELSLRLGDNIRAEENFKKALNIARLGLLPEYEWRALAGLGRRKEAMASLNSVNLLRAGIDPGELAGKFSPMVEGLIREGEIEEAFNLIERLSETERVGRLMPMALGALKGDQKRLLVRAYPRLVAMRSLSKEFRSANAEEKRYIANRVKQEKELLGREIDGSASGLPEIIKLADQGPQRNLLMIILGLAVHAEEVADEAVKKSESSEGTRLRRTYEDLLNRYRHEIERAQSVLQDQEVPGILGILIPDPVEAIDLMETISEEETIIRLFAIKGPRPAWAAFSISTEDIEVKFLEGREELDRLTAEYSIVAYENLSELSLAGDNVFALSATHLFRSIGNRKPFKRNTLIFPPGKNPAGYFKNIPLPQGDSEKRILETMPDIHTLMFNGPVFMAESVATRAGDQSLQYMAMGLDEGKTLPLLHLRGRLSNLSLAMLPGASLNEVYELGHLFSLLGVPTVLLPKEPIKESAFPNNFLKAYASASIEEAKREALSALPSKETWIQIGDYGLAPEEASQLADKLFSGYVAKAKAAFEKKRYRRSLQLIENAIEVVSKSKTEQKSLHDLYKAALRSSNSAGMLDKSLRYAEVLVKILSEKKRGSDSHAKALLELGILYSRKEQYDKAVPRLEEAVEMMAELELGPDRIKALSELGIVLENATEYDRALEHFRSAVSLSGSMGLQDLLARQKMRIGRIHDLRLSQYARALESYRVAYEVYRSLGQKVSSAQSLLDMGRCYRLLGNFSEAEAHYEKALGLLGPERESERLKTKVLLEKANNAWYQSRIQEAFNLQQEVYKRALKHGWLHEQVMSLNTAGLIWWSLGNNQRAIGELKKALELSGALRARQDERATTLNNLGMVYREMGQYEKAIESLDEALKIDRKIRSQWAIAYDLRNKAMTYLRMGEHDKAVPLFDEALFIAKGIGNRINEAKIYLGYGEALLALGRYPEARKKYQDALKFSRSMALRETEWRALFGLGQLSLKEEDNEAAKESLGRAIEVIEEMRAEIKLDQLKDGFIVNKMSVYETLVSLLVDLGKVPEAFNMAERSRARNLIDLLGNQRLSLYGSVDQELYDRQKRLRARIREQERLMAQSETERERTVYGRVFEDLRNEFQDVMLEIQSKNPELASLVRVNPLTLPEIQALLQPDVALLTFYMLPDRILYWLIRSESFEQIQTPVDRETLERAILSYRRMIQNLEPLESQSRQLYSWLFSKITPKLEGVRVVGIIPHGSLHYLSFATLNDGRNYVADRFSLFYLPSASVYRYTLEKRRKDKNVQVLAIGNPLLAEPALDLPFAEREVASIGWNFPDITILTKEKAKESWVVQNIGKFGIIHLASHGRFDPINPLFSSLKLVKDIHADGELEAAEIFGLNINADLILLSACQTGLGKVTSGDDVIGMNRAFLYAGSHAVISSLWRVSDISTAMLVKQFYREYVSKNKADSLRKALLHVKNRYPHPGYWGPFVLVGDYD